MTTESYGSGRVWLSRVPAGSSHTGGEGVQVVSSLVPRALALWLCPSISHCGALTWSGNIALPITQEIYGWYSVPAVARFADSPSLTGSFNCADVSGNSTFIQFSLQSQWVCLLLSSTLSFMSFWSLPVTDLAKLWHLSPKGVLWFYSEA